MSNKYYDINYGGILRILKDDLKYNYSIGDLQEYLSNYLCECLGEYNHKFIEYLNTNIGE